MSEDISRDAETRQPWAQTGLAAVRHADLNLTGFGATNRMTVPSPLLPVAIAILAGAAFDTNGGEPPFAATYTKVGYLQQSGLYIARGMTLGGYSGFTHGRLGDGRYVLTLSIGDFTRRIECERFQTWHTRQRVIVRPYECLCIMFIDNVGR